MDVVTQHRHLEEIGERFAAVAPEGWARLVGNWEATPVEGAPADLNWLTLAVVDGGDRWLYGQLSYDEPLYDLVTELHAWSVDQGEPWSVLDLELDRNGDFRTSFGYDGTPRTDGVADRESLGRFEGYLDSWVAEHGADPRSAS